ncbi:hypothetical protein Fcan01_11782 [Folsomia candida]|uniref:Peptidase aspartic putative domain-containing protein n=1 Tax=Folsomia candida TaxID=158441 RepID=A0A226EBV4_FOLCA|nr:hypothetical protein Fcan01_11782 [Folsomia candida]
MSAPNSPSSLRREDRDRHPPDRYTPTNGGASQRHATKPEDDEDKYKTPQRQESSQAILNGLRNPFSATKKKESLSSSSSNVKKAEADEQLQENIMVIEDEIAEFKHDIEMSQAELENIQAIISKTAERINSTSPDFETDKIEENKSELRRMKDEVVKKELEHKKIVSTSNCKIIKKENEKLWLQKKHATAITKIDQEEDQRLSSDEEAEYNDAVVKFNNWSKNNAEEDLKEDGQEKLICKHDPVPISSPRKESQDCMSQPDALVLIAQTLQAMQMSMNKPASSSTTDKLLARQSVGRDLPSFSGRPEEWPIFFADLKRSTEICEFSPSENLHRLRKCLKGEAAKAVQSMMVSPDNLQRIVDTLRIRFGQPKHIIEAMIDKVREFPFVREDKLDTIVEFATAVINLASTIKSLERDEYLRDPTLLRELEKKMSPQFQMQWADWIMASSLRVQDLDHFATWIAGRTEVVCSIHRPSFKEEKEEKGKFQDYKNDGRWNKKGQVYAAQESQQEEQGPRKCNVCEKENHFTNQCRILRALDADHRKQVIMDKGLCLSCLQPGCIISDCRKKVKCDLDGCKYYHHRLVHGTTKPFQPVYQQASQQEESPDEDTPAETQINSLLSGRLMYVGVQVMGPCGKEVILALQDNGSEATLLEEDVRRSIGAKGPASPFCMTTPAGKSNQPISQSISLCILGLKGSKFEKINNVRTLDEVNLSRVSLDVENLKAKYPHLRSVPLRSFRNEKPQMLIGSSHYHLLNPIKTIEGKPGEPVAIKTRLGWTVVIPDLNGIGRNDIRINHQEAQVHHFQVHQVCELSPKNEADQVKQSFTAEKLNVQPFSSKPKPEESKKAGFCRASIKPEVRHSQRFLWRRMERDLEPEVNNNEEKTKQEIQEIRPTDRPAETQEQEKEPVVKERAENLKEPVSKHDVTGTRSSSPQGNIKGIKPRPEKQHQVQLESHADEIWLPDGGKRSPKSSRRMKKSPAYPGNRKEVRAMDAKTTGVHRRPALKIAVLDQKNEDEPPSPKSSTTVIRGKNVAAKHKFYNG